MSKPRLLSYDGMLLINRFACNYWKIFQTYTINHTNDNMSLAWDVLQHYQIDKARTAAETASMKVDSLSARKDSTKQELEELTLACQAMWELLRDHIGFTDDHLKAKILEIDARDGSVDGKIGAEILDCPHCGQKASTTKPNCIYCGNRLPSNHVMK